jgi:hypothetical protein
MAIIIQRKPPERDLVGMTAAPAGDCCCCCCCCCLHSVGGMIGALTAAPKKVEPESLPISSTERGTLEPKTSAGGLYWPLVAIMCGLMIAYVAAADHDSVGLGEALFLVALGLPFAQLAASLVAALAIAGSKRVGKEARMGHLGRITLRAFVGAVIGLVLMLPFLFMLK